MRAERPGPGSAVPGQADGAPDRHAGRQVGRIDEVENAAGAAACTPSWSDSTVEVDEGFDRAWRRVGLALDRVGFTVEDRDRVNGVYFVRYVDPDLPPAPPAS